MKKDVEKEQVLRDSTSIQIGELLYSEKINVPGETLEYTLPIEFDSNGNLKTDSFKSETKRLSFEAVVGKNNKVKFKLQCKDYEEQIQRYKTLNNTYKFMLDKEKERLSKETVIYQVPLWCWITIIVESLIIALTLIYAINKIKSKFF